MMITISKKMIAYEPLLVNDQYVDNLELFEKNKPGKEHVCECRGNHDTFSGRTAFTQHIKLKCHQKWLTGLRINPMHSDELSPRSISLPPLSLRAEQDDEYERTLKEDRKKADDKLNSILKESEAQYAKEQEKREKDEELDRKRRRIVSEPGYTFRFIFPDGKKVSYTMHKTRLVSYMRDIVDVYMVDHQNIFNYELFMFPNKILDFNQTIEEAGIENRTTIYVRSLEN
jgi:hypothetical protein